MRGYRGVFWHVFVRGKCTRVGEKIVESVMECRDRK